MSELMEQLKNEIHLLKKQIEATIQEHQDDPDLAHRIGSDSYCLYCEKHQEYQKEFKRVTKKIKDLEFSLIKKFLYHVIHIDTQETLVFATSFQESCEVLGIEKAQIKDLKMIPQSYWKEFYIEDLEFGHIRTVEELTRDQQSKVIAGKEKLARYRGQAFNSVPFPYFKYNQTYFDEFELFCQPSKVVRTKKFELTGKLAIQTSHGMIAIAPDDYLVKITPEHYLVFSEDDFQKFFDDNNNMNWYSIE